MTKLALLMVSSTLVSFSAWSKEPYARIVQVQGEVTTGGAALKVGDPLQEGAILKSGAGAHALFVVGKKQAALRLNENSELKLGTAQNAEFQLVRGAVGAHIRKASLGKKQFRMRTRAAVMGVRGTSFFVADREEKRIYFCPCEGKISVTSVAKGAELLGDFDSKAHDYESWLIPGEKPQVKPEKGKPMIEHSDAQIDELKKLLE